MAEFRYRDASDFALHTRHFRCLGDGRHVMDADAVAICSGIAATVITERIKSRSGPVLTVEELERGIARTDIVRVKIGRSPSVYDVLREFGDEAAEAGLLCGGAE